MSHYYDVPNLVPWATAHVDYAKYLLKILALLKVIRVSSGIQTNAYNFLLKKGKSVLKQNLDHLDFFTQLDLKNYLIVNMINFKDFLLNLYYI